MRTLAIWLSRVLIFVIPWENAVTIVGLGTLVRVTGLFVALFWMATVLVAGRFRKLGLFHLAVGLFVLWNVASVFWSSGAEETVQRIKTYLQLFGMVCLLWDLYTTSTTLRAGLQSYILGAYVSIASILFNFLAGKEVSAFSGGRYTGSDLNAGDLALILALGLPVAWQLVVSAGDSKESHILRLVNYAYIPWALFAILLTASRMALFAILPAFFFVLGTIARLKFSSRILVFGALAGALFALQPHVPRSSVERLATASTSVRAGDLGGRVDIWRAGIAVFSEHPIMGVGSGAFRRVVAFNAVAHNTFLSVLVELGVIGFVLFLIVLAVAVYKANRQSRWDSRFWLTLLSVWAVGVSAQTWEHRKPTWLFLSLLAVSASLSSRPAESALHAESSVGLKVLLEGEVDEAEGAISPARRAGLEYVGDSRLLVR